jgi:ribosome modulation factor
LTSFDIDDFNDLNGLCNWLSGWRSCHEGGEESGEND